jgi:REP element-mobilizing transposase RayT
MKYNPDIHHRHSIRLKGYDYSQPGAYFVTIVTHLRQCLFGEIANNEMILNDYGKISEQCWNDIPKHYPNAITDEFVIMPNHIHGIIILNDNGSIVGAKNFSPLLQNERPRGTTQTIGSIVRGFKIGVTKWFRQNSNIYSVWQRNYYEHIIRNEIELNNIRKYILNNPLNWKTDKNYKI